MISDVDFFIINVLNSPAFETRNNLKVKKNKYKHKSFSISPIRRSIKAVLVGS